jgi:putative PIN family toxin of toxin-antitoxin system
MRVVLDANVVASGVCWSGEAYRCLAVIGRRQAVAFGSQETLFEAEDVASHLIRAKKPAHNAPNRLNWYLHIVKLVEPAPLGKQRSRDAKDDPYLAVALAAKASIVTYDKDLLDLSKPFGIEILRPAEFLNRFRV